MMLLAIFFTTAIAGATYYLTLSGFTFDQLKETYDPLDGENSGGDEAIEATEPLTLLFMGVDTGTGSRTEDWVGNSDSMLLVTINPKTKKTTMMSLERDILVDLSASDGELTGQQNKLNAAYQEGEKEGAIATIEALMNIQIDHYVMINMQGMIDLVDAVGGITVDNKFDFDISIADQEPEYTAIVPPGKQKVNGEQALVYARMRYQDPHGDYGRQQRQREVIQKIMAKVLSMNSVSRYQKILDAVAKNMRTSVRINASTTPQLLGYRDALKNIKTYQLTGVDAMFNGASYQIVTSEHLLEMQNILQKSLGEEEYTELETSAVLYETIYGVTAETPDYTNPSASMASSSQSSDSGQIYGTEGYSSDGTEVYGTDPGTYDYQTDPNAGAYGY